MTAPRFDASTVVADVIAADPGAVERLANLHSAFRKLRNPILRRTMARLVTLGDAARIAGLPVETVVAAANGEAVAAVPDEAGESASSEVEPAPPWMATLDREAATRLDVRPMFDRGEPPLGEIMRAAATIADGGTLIVEAPFDPAPLHRALARKGFVSYAEPIAPDHWRVYFHRTAAAQPETVREDGTAKGKSWREDDGVHIDVRGLEPPQPMMAILKLLEEPETGEVVIVHHEREPLFLYPELAERGWDHAIIPGAEGEVRLRLTRQP